MKGPLQLAKYRRQLARPCALIDSAEGIETRPGAAPPDRIVSRHFSLHTLLFHGHVRLHRAHKSAHEFSVDLRRDGIHIDAFLCQKFARVLDFVHMSTAERIQASVAE